MHGTQGSLKQWLPSGKLLLLSLTKCHGVPCSLPSRMTTKVLKNCKTFSSRPKPRPSPRLIFVFEAPRDQDPGFELCCIMHSVFNGKCPAYLSDIVQTVSASRPRLRLRSSSSTDYVLPRLRTKFGERAFSHSGPSAWSRLPEDIRAEPDITNFRKLLKTHYFNSAFNVQ